MSFASRMTTETGAPMPRYLYLILKPVETLAGGVALAAVTALSPLWTTTGVAIVYVALGLWLWYRNRRVVISTARGEIVGDAAYHGILSLAAVAFVLPIAPPLRLAAFIVCAALWWQLDTDGFGVVRAPDAP